MALILTACFLFALINCSAVSEQTSATAMIDWRRTIGMINRPIFSTQGFMQVYVCDNPMVLDTFKLINPKDTHTRLETYIHKMEPENDNDDPSYFNWEKLYPLKMIRFIDNSAKFEQTLNELGMEPISLLGFLVPWLKSDDPANPIKDIDEWVEFACAVIHSYNVNGVFYSPNLRFVEIWNEPNMTDFYTGTMESYFELFLRSAERIHRDYPGVMVGGPSITHAWHCKPDEWMEAFLKKCAPQADFISYHHYGPQDEPVTVLTNDIKKWVGKFRSIPGKQQGKVMITEIDAWFQGWLKMQHIMERQFRFLELSDLILGIHHFCCLAYNESGNYTFGIVNTQGGVIGGVFWPYWLFRNLIGHQSYTSKQGTDQLNFDLIASHYENNGRWIATAIFHNKKQKPLRIETFLYFPLSQKDRILAFNAITRKFQGIEKVFRITSGTDRMHFTLTLEPGEGLALNLQESGRRVFPFRDLNNQETPWVQLIPSKDQISFGEPCDLKVRILNTYFSPVNGTIKILGLPEQWEAELLEGNANLESLKFGSRHLCKYRIKATSLVPGGKISPYAVIQTSDKIDLDKTPHSIPATIKVLNPIKTQILPVPVYAAPEESNQVTLQVRNMIEENVSGSFEIELPEGCEAQSPAGGFSIPQKEMKRFHFPFSVKEAKPGDILKGKITLNYLDTILEKEFRVEVVWGKPEHNALPLDIKKWVNIDAAAFFENRMDFDREKIGLFVFPADFTPSGRIAKIRGIPFRFASLGDGKKNAILPQAQILEMPEGNYKEVAFIGFGHDGDHPGDWTFHYKDESKEKVASRIPEWCTPPPEGFEVALTAPYRYIKGGPATPPCELFAWRLPLNSSKTLAAIELPEMKHAYIFAITLLEEE